MRSKEKGLLLKSLTWSGSTWIDLFASTNRCLYIRQPMAGGCVLWSPPSEGKGELVWSWQAFLHLTSCWMDLKQKISPAIQKCIWNQLAFLAPPVTNWATVFSSETLYILQQDTWEASQRTLMPFTDIIKAACDAKSPVIFTAKREQHCHWSRSSYKGVLFLRPQASSGPSHRTASPSEP